MQTNNFICLAEEIRLIELLSCKRLALTEDLLMQRAAKAVLSAVEKYYPRAKRIIVLCGSGKNGGDGYIFAKYAHQSGLDVALYTTSQIEKLSDNLRHVALNTIATGIPILSLDDLFLLKADLIVDALLGTGLRGELSDIYVEVIDIINKSKIPVLAIDLPSGLCTDSGVCKSVAIKADLTVSMIANKLGFYMNDGPDLVGRVILDDLMLTEVIDDVLSESAMIKLVSYFVNLTKRPRNCHKGNFGSLLVIGGNIGMPGAPIIAGQFALAVGVGKVTIVTRDIYAKTIIPDQPEILIHGIEDPDEIQQFSDVDVIVIGPGLGDDDWARDILQEAISLEKKMIVDASALRILSDNFTHNNNWILTPHVGEAAAMLNTEVDEINFDRFGSVVKLQKQYGGIVVLKGVGTLIADAQQVYLANAGNPGMASAGMGDALSGIIAGLYANCMYLHELDTNELSLLDAAKFGVMLHARAADYLARRLGEQGMVVTDLLECVRRLINID